MALLMKAVILVLVTASPASARRIRKDGKKLSLQKENFNTLVSLDKDGKKLSLQKENFNTLVSLDKDGKKLSLQKENFNTLVSLDKDKTVVASDSSTHNKAPVEKWNRHKIEKKGIEKKKRKKEKKHKKDKHEDERAKLLRKVCHVEAVRGSSHEWERLAVCTLTFATPPSMRNRVRIDLGDVVKVAVPHYKTKSYSMSAERPGEFDITFKVYPNGRSSGYLDSLEVGNEITVSKKGKKDRSPGSHVGVIAFGIGITEALPIAAAELAKPEAQHVRLLWASRTYGDLFWHEKIAALQAAYPKRFSVETILSREQRDGSLHGRVSPEALAAVFDGAWGTAAGGPNEAQRDGVRFLSVGTKEMMRSAARMLRQIGYRTPLLL